MTEKEKETIKVMGIVFGSVFMGLMVLFYAITVVLYDPNETYSNANLPEGYNAKTLPETPFDIAEPAQFRQNQNTEIVANWRDDVNYSVSTVEPFVPSSTIEYVVPEATTTEEQKLLDLILQLPTHTEMVIPAALDLVNPRRDGSIISSFSSIPQVSNYPVLKESSFDNCGSASYDDKQSDLEDYIKSLSEDSAAICLGKAIADDCDPARVRYFDNYVSGYVYVVENYNGECSVGTSVGDGLIVLCTVKSLMDAAYDESKSFSEWQELFDEEPGQTFVDTYLASQNALLSAKVSTAQGCDTHQL